MAHTGGGCVANHYRTYIYSVRSVASTSLRMPGICLSLLALILTSPTKHSTFPLPRNIFQIILLLSPTSPPSITCPPFALNSLQYLSLPSPPTHHADTGGEQGPVHCTASPVRHSPQLQKAASAHPPPRRCLAACLCPLCLPS